jgi:exopolysaccharide production protein ExoZ
MTYNLLQVCRGVAATLVVLFHLSGALAAEKYFNEPFFQQIFHFGSAGVHLFFVLSGFIIFATHYSDLGNPERVGRYLVRRAIRIFPPYWLVFFVVAAFTLGFPEFRSAVPQETTVLVKSLLLWPQNPAEVGGTGAPLIIVAWSLQYELVFYLCFGFFVASPAVGFLVLFVGVIWGMAAMTSTGLPAYPLAFMKWWYFAIFGFGVVAAWLVRRDWIVRPAFFVALGIILFLFIALFEYIEMVSQGLDEYPPRSMANSLLYGVGAAFLVYGLAASEKLRPRDAPGFLKLMGDASYMIYLVHFPIISVACKFFVIFGLRSFGSSCVALVFITALSVGVGLASHLIVERPLLKYLRSNASQRRWRGEGALLSPVKGLR